MGKQKISIDIFAKAKIHRTLIIQPHYHVKQL